MGTTGLETSFAAVYTELVVPGRPRRSTLVVERLTDGGALFDLPTPRDRRRRARQPRRSSTSTREWIVGEDGYESRSANCCFDGRRLRGRVAADRRRRRRRLPRAHVRG